MAAPKHPQREISIHALREEGDLFLLLDAGNRNGFLSTPSVRRATCFQPSSSISDTISIHALREEGDAFRASSVISMFYFYPRPP